MNDYVVLDLETPNRLNNAITSIAVLIVEDNIIVESIDQLINPETYFDDENIRLTGIYPEDVVDCPRFDEYWPCIKDYLAGNVIVGHNIKFDLNVLSKVLDYHHLSVPEFDYYCTLRLSRKYFNLKSYRLKDVAGHIGFYYRQHIAVEDAIASYHVFEHINEKEDIPLEKCGHYHYRLSFKDSYDEALTLTLNNFYGMLYILRYYKEITSCQFDLIKSWHDKNKGHDDTTVFNNLNKQLHDVLSKEKITSRDIEFLLTRTPPVMTSNLYDDECLLLGILAGIVRIIRLDNKVDMDKLGILYEWLMDNSLLKGKCFYDDIMEITRKSLNNGIITLNDEKKLLKLYDNLLDIYFDDF